MATARFVFCFSVLGLVSLALATPRPARTPAQAQQELAHTLARIRAVTAAVHGEVAERDAAAGALHRAETDLAAARNRLDDVHERVTASEARAAELKGEAAAAERRLVAERASLAGHARAAYETGREESLKLLLNAADPARLGRSLVYYGYLGRARAHRIRAIAEELVHLETIETALAVEAGQLQGLEAEQSEQVATLATARATRARALATVKAEIDTKSTELKRLKANAASLEDLVARLREALAASTLEEPRYSTGHRRPFERERGALPWPARGRILARFGDERPGGLRWQGLLLETAPGAPVRAPYYGRVVYSDWLPGLGLLVIVDHGDGYLTLYGHNERLYRAVGAQVAPGELLAASGAGEGQPAPELYFEIRHGTHTVDPGPWLKAEARR